ncbi:hypothetical protein F511_28904 [Dorcoceras hygrometricum]|uniref:Uncharacterized protein n=1 Tax=Dorcoceras hygrometricum TaxID=472368 RepID=A0A2Z7C477_9LAMI|nr:hypothetical protein F511_28904 [Dorcoceras hygrometricum]
MPSRRSGRGRGKFQDESGGQNEEQRSFPSRGRGRREEEEVDDLATRVESMEIVMARFQRMSPQAAAPPQGRGGSSWGRSPQFLQPRVGETQFRPFKLPGPSRFGQSSQQHFSGPQHAQANAITREQAEETPSRVISALVAVVLWQSFVDSVDASIRRLRMKKTISSSYICSADGSQYKQSAVGLVFMESAAGLAMETSKVESAVRNQAEAKVNQLEHRSVGIKVEALDSSCYDVSFLVGWRQNHEAAPTFVCCVVQLLVRSAVGSISCWFDQLLVRSAVGSISCWFDQLLVRSAVGSISCWFDQLLVRSAVGSISCWFDQLLVEITAMTTVFVDRSVGSKVEALDSSCYDVSFLVGWRQNREAAPTFVCCVVQVALRVN